MSTETKELLEICERLPRNRREEVADFARFLLARESDERWEQLIDSPKRLPKLEEFLRESAAEGQAEPRDPERL